LVRTRTPYLIPPASKYETSTLVKPIGIYSVFILHKSGCPFFHRIYDSRGSETDPAILGGFFTALSLFAEEVTTGQIESLIAGSCRYTFQALQHGLLVLCSSKEFNPITLDEIMKQIIKLLLTKYRQKLSQPQPASVSAPSLGPLIDKIFIEKTSKRLRKIAY
jgi:hypothetical protein